MNQTNRRPLRIDNVNRAAVGDVNAERDAALVCDQTVAARKFPVLIERNIDKCDLVAVDLLGSRQRRRDRDRKSTRLNSSHDQISYAVFCLKKKKTNTTPCK